MKKCFLLCEKMVFITIALLCGYNLLAQSNQCYLTVADVERVFGRGFQAEPTMKLGEITSCKFTTKDYTIEISIQPAYGMRIADYHRQMSPKTITWKAIPNDPDGAMIEDRDPTKDDLAFVPAVTYIRNNKYVRLQVLGIYYDEPEQRIAKREEMRTKLAKLKRVP